MKRYLCTLLSSASVVLLATPAPADTWVVDDDGGPGVDFQDIQPAIDAAAPGDVVLVEPGQYSEFTVDKPLVVLGRPDDPAFVWTEISVEGIPAGATAVVAEFWVLPLIEPLPSLHVRDCPGTVVVDHVFAGGGTSTVTDCADVRLTGVNLGGTPGGSFPSGGVSGGTALRVTNARVEIVASTITGGIGGDCPNCQFDGGAAGDGGRAILARDGAEIHLARSQVAGGWGGDAFPSTPGDTVHPGRGGEGLRVSDDGGAASEALITGLAEHVLRGGAGGTAPGETGADGPGLVVLASAARVSGATISSTRLTPGSWFEEPAAPDPVLALLDTPAPGSRAFFRIDAPEGSEVDLVLGRGPVLFESPGLVEDRLVPSQRVLDLGTIDSSGQVTTAFGLSATWPRGLTFFAQGEVRYPDGTTRLTTSVPLVLR